MKSKLHGSTAAPPNSKTGKTVSAGNASSASVPIGLYRELTAELQQTQERLREAMSRNEELAHQNQQLRHEIGHMLQAALHLRQRANQIQPDAPILPQLDGLNGSYRQGEPQAMNLEGSDAIATDLSSLLKPLDSTTASSDSTPDASVSVETLGQTITLNMPSHPKLVTMTTQGQSGSSTRTKAPQFPKRWGLTLIVIFVVITAFGAGFLGTLYLQSRPNQQDQ